MRQALGPGALGGPGGSGWRERWEGGSGWGRHVSAILISIVQMKLLKTAKYHGLSSNTQLDSGRTAGKIQIQTFMF